MSGQESEAVVQRNATEQDYPAKILLFADESLLEDMKSAAFQHLLAHISKFDSTSSNSSSAGGDIGSSTAVKDEVLKFIAGSEWDERLEDCVYRRLRGPLQHEASVAAADCRSHAFLQKYERLWIEKVLASLADLANVVTCEPAGFLPDRRKKGRAAAHWKNLSIARHLAELRSQKFHAILSNEEYLDFITAIVDESFVSNASSSDSHSRVGFLTQRMCLPVGSWFSMKSLLKPLLGYGSAGLSRSSTQAAGTHPAGRAPARVDRGTLALRALHSGQAAVCQEVAKLACTVEHRAQIWQCILVARPPKRSTIATSDENIKARDSLSVVDPLKSKYIASALLLDGAVQLDVHDSPANNDNFFVLEDEIHATMLLLLRDDWLREYSTWSLMSSHYLLEPDVQALLEHQDDQLPPSGIVPGQGFSFLAAPVCFIMSSMNDFYAVFRQLYARYFCHLQAPCSARRFGLLSLLYQVEALLQQRTPHLFEHLVLIGTPVMDIVLPWMMTAFAAVLPTEQILILWDLLIGYDTTEVLAVVAAALFAFRSSTLLAIKSKSGVTEVMSDFRNVSVIAAVRSFFS
eukprot:scpid46853/ scgid34765/ TBC1 domain family member 19